MSNLRKIIAIGGMAAVAALLSAGAAAAPITCLSTADQRYMALDNITGGPPTCHDAGLINEPNPYNGQPLLWKIEFAPAAIEGPGPNPFVFFTGGNSTSGSLELIAGLTNHFLVFKFGNGQADPDWVAYAVNGMTKADWSFIANEGYRVNALSHVAIYGSLTEVPEPAGLALLGLGLVLVGFRARRARG